MASQSLLPFTSQKVMARRENRKHAIVKFFSEIPGCRISTLYLHERFGTSVRTRISEINRNDEWPIRICNETSTNELGQQSSVYWAEARR